MPIIENNTELNQRIHFWNKIYRISLIVLVVIAIGIVTLVAQKIDTTTEEIKKTQEAQVASTLEARKANIERQNNFEDYIKCLSLLRFENPDGLKTKEGVIKSLDKCAAEH